MFKKEWNSFDRIMMLMAMVTIVIVIVLSCGQ